MMTNYSIAIPCKPYIKKYFETLHGSPVPLKLKNEFGDTILTKMSGPPLTRITKEMMNITFKYFTAEIKFQLPIDFFFRIDHKLSEQQIYSINKYLERYFDSDLITLIHIGKFFGVERITVIESFIQSYNLSDDDIAVRSLVKKDQRYWKNQNTAKTSFLQSLRSPFPIVLRS